MEEGEQEQIKRRACLPIIIYMDGMRLSPLLILVSLPVSDIVWQCAHVSFKGHSKLIFSFWSYISICSSMIQFMRTTVNMHKFPWMKWLLCSSEKWNGVLCIRRPPKHLSSPSVATTMMSSSSRRTFWYIRKATVATMGLILHMQYGDFIKG